jgi:hypothetical protein
MFHVKVYSVLTNIHHDYEMNSLFDAHKDFIGEPVYDSLWVKFPIGIIVDAWLNNDKLCLLLRICATLLPFESRHIRFFVTWSMVIDAETKQLERMNNLSCYVGSARNGPDKDQQVTWTYTSSLSLLNLL